LVFYSSAITLAVSDHSRSYKKIILSNALGHFRAWNVLGGRSREILATEVRRKSVIKCSSAQWK